MTTHHLLFFFILFTKISYSSSQSSNFSSINFCPEIERNSLLTFKQSLQDPGNKLSSWGNGEAMNCCKWEGVVCNNSTGHVSHLHLHSDDYNWYGDEGYHLGRKINTSLLNLKHLTFLDLSNSDFSGETIPSFIGSLSSLEYLNLSHARFEGKIPTSIGNLSNLHTLDLDDNDLKSDSLQWLSRLSKLEYLNLNHANLSRASNWGEVINSLPRLLELHLSSCSIHPSDQPHHVMNNLTTSLKFIDFSFNDFTFLPIPQWFFQLETLVYLDLSYNSFSGQIPTVSNATKLQFLDLYDNNFNSSIPDWVYSCKDLKFLHLSRNSIQGQISESIGNLTSLQSLDLSYNSIGGQISESIGNLTSLERLRLSENQLSGKLPTQITSLCRLQSLALYNNGLQGDLQDSFGNMSECFLGSLKFLDLIYNQLSGHLTEQFGDFKRLTNLHLSYNSLSGRIPISIGSLASLVYFAIDHNKFTGNIPVSLGQLSQMLKFDVENNQLEGVVTESHFANLSNLQTFSASGNKLTLRVGPNWTPPRKTRTLELRSWRLGSGIPSWLQTRLDNIDYLDLSETGISGAPPAWFFDISFLNISNNNLHGRIRDLNNSRAFMYVMSWNNFSGSLPRIGGDGVMMMHLDHLDLSHNHFSEGLSDFLCHPTSETYLINLLLEGNRLSGELPDCWQKWPSLRYLNLGNNLISGHLPNSFGFLWNLMSLNLYGNKFSGPIPFSMRNCTGLRKMDLGRNSLDGNVPTWIGTSLTELKFLILHSNNFSGGIPSELCHLQSLQILDLSLNKISGVIPKCVHNLTAMDTKRELGVWEMELGSIVFREGGYSAMKADILYRESASIATKGGELEYSTILSLVTNMDLSSNNLRGGIPKELTSLVQLGSLNLSRNQLSGLIPDSIGQMKQLESLDLSSNSLSGQIPNNFTLLSSLSFLNLSFNNLSGRIPQSTQLQTMDASSFIGNDLCGPPLARNWSSCDGEDEVHGHEGEERRGEIEWMYVFLSVGYAVGFSGVCSVLVLKKRWRDAYFGVLEKMWDKIYVYFHVWIQRL